MDATEQVRLFSEFFETQLYQELIERVNKGIPAITIPFSDLARYNVDLAQELLEDPDNVLSAAKHTLEHLDLGEQGKKLEVRVKGLPKTSTIKIKDIRSTQLGVFLELEGLVRQKSDVRPQVTAARFECPSCGNIIPVLQTDQKFREPSMCGSCGRKGQFRLIHKELVDAQKIVLEESPEDLEGGEQPKRLDIFLKKDLVSPISDKKTNPGNKIRITGIIKEVPIQLNTGGKSVRFDLMCEVNHVEPIQEEFTNIVLTPEETQEILEKSKDPTVYEHLARSLAPTIYGHEQIKEALLLQLFGGVQKSSDDGVTRRGDIHILLIGDPGSGKCVHASTQVMLSDGAITTMKELVGVVEEHQRINPVALPALQLNGTMGEQQALRVWRRREEQLLKIRLRSGKELLVTENHPLFTTKHACVYAQEAKEFATGSYVATPRKVFVTGRVQSLPFIPKNHHNTSKHYSYPPTLSPSLARILGYLCGDGYVARSKTSARISFTNNDDDLLADYQSTFNALFSRPATIRTSRKGKTAGKIYVTSKNLYEYFLQHTPEIVCLSAHKTIPQLVLKSDDNTLSEFIKALFDCDAHVNKKKRQIEFCTISQELASTLQQALLRFGVVAFVKKKKTLAKNSSRKRIMNKYDLSIPPAFTIAYAERIGFTSTTKREALNSFINSDRNTNVDVIPGVRELLVTTRKRLGLRQQDLGVSRSAIAHYEQKNRVPSRQSLHRIAGKLGKIAPNDVQVAMLEQLAGADIFWDEILSTERTTNDEQYVYDLEVSNTHNFVANGVIIHNSQLIKRISTVAPKARFVSGKGSSGAGLTATVVKDEFMRGWALEAGALVLANNGHVCIDELDKMTPDDTSALHEGLEQQTITISKANIQATLRCKTTVLAAANPKFGRFDPYEMIAKQIELPSTLINRFDLIFPVRDVPDEGKDDQMASFILNLHKGTKEEKDDTLLDTKFIRKYIAYAKQHCLPELTTEALEEIKRYYIQMRKQGVGEGTVSTIAISARQLEGLVRLSEASAKTRLSPTVTKKDAKRAIDLTHHCLGQLGMDPDTGKIDIDRMTTGITAAQRSHISLVKEVITGLEKAIGKLIPVDDVVRESEMKGISSDKTHEILEKLKRAGDVFNPKPNFISKI